MANQNCLALLLLVLIAQLCSAQDTFSCGTSDMMILSPWIYTNNQQCGDIVSAVPDIYSDIYRSECQRQLALEAKPATVNNADITTCFGMANGTSKYQARVCCPGTLSGMRCFECINETVQYDTYQRRYVTDHCNHYKNITTCSNDQVCATVFTYEGGNKVSKMCVDSVVCNAEQAANSVTCDVYNENQRCAYCCTSPLCNYYQPWKSRPYPPSSNSNPPRFACIDYNPCNYFGTCVLNDTVNDNMTSSTTTAPKQPDYYCLCKNGTYGKNCQYNECSFGPCKNQADCLKSVEWPYYICYCRAGWYGVNCTQQYDQCNSTLNDYCLNNGTCFDQGAFGVICKCADKFYGTRCEYEDLGVNKCPILPSGFPYLYRDYSSSSIITNNSCSEMVLQYSLYMSNGYAQYCVSVMNRGFEQGVDGDISKMFIKYRQIHQCEKGNIKMWYRYGFCCPACTAKPCENRGWCIQNGEEYQCKCRLGYEGDRCQHKVATCLAYGDPHFLTFDKLVVHFQGTCTYLLAASKEGASVETAFKVLIKHEQRGNNPDVSYVRYLQLHVYDHVVRIDRDQLVSVNGTVVDTTNGVSLAEGKLKVERNGFYMRAATTFGLVMEFDGYWTAKVKLPANYEGQTEGLCGNSNHDTADDLITSDGINVFEDVHRYSLFGNSWQHYNTEDPNCVGRIDPPVENCTDIAINITNSDLCGPVLDIESSVFGPCLDMSGMDPGLFAEACQYDVCTSRAQIAAMKEAACGTLQALAAECENRGFPVDWRQATNCLANCTGGMVYSASASPCLVTCENPRAVEQCSLPNTETCLCLPGTAFNGQECVQPEQCGCTDENGTHHQVGDSWSSQTCIGTDVCVFCADCSGGYGVINTICSALSPCGSSPCLNGGTCSVTGMSTFQCTCPQNYTGLECEAQITYEYGEWSRWTCSSNTTESRTRNCTAYPDGVTVNSAFCTGQHTEERTLKGKKCKKYEEPSLEEKLVAPLVVASVAVAVPVATLVGIVLVMKCF